MSHEAAARMIQLAREGAGNFACSLSQSVFSVLDGPFREILNLRLCFFLVPFGRLVELFDHLVLQIAGFSFQFRQVAIGN